MKLTATSKPRPTFNPALRGFQALYRTGDRCPGCNKSHWLIGRITAQCAFCATALPLEQSKRR